MHTYSKTHLILEGISTIVWVKFQKLLMHQFCYIALYAIHGQKVKQLENDYRRARNIDDGKHWQTWRIDL